jgi:hypothetical protein
MIIHSIMPEERIFEGFEENHPKYMELEYSGVTMQVEVLGPQQAKIVRLLSPNANDYLNPSFAPGSFIEFQPAIR